MKMRFLTGNLFFSLALCGNIVASPTPQVTLTTPQDYKHIECIITPRNSQAEHRSHPNIPPKRKYIRSPKGQLTSTNWGGYVAANDLNNPATGSVSAVYGTWIVPTITGTSRSNTYCAYWVGIDGNASPTVEQLGTSHNWINGRQQHSAWFEMYPLGSYTITGFPVAPGDIISASVVYVGNNVFTLSMQNVTKQVSYTVPASYTTSATAQRNSAEWIVEAPFLNTVLPLSNFSTAYLFGCLATINGITALMSNSSWQNAAIEMITSTGTIKATTSDPLQGSDSFYMKWAHQ